MTFTEIVPTEQVEIWRDIIVNASATTPGKKIESVHGSGYSYAPLNTSTKLTRNRFIIWRVIGQTLELLETSFDTNLQNNAIRLHFNQNLIPSVSIYERPQGSEPVVIIVCATVSRDLYRLVLPHPSSFNRPDINNVSIFSGYSAQQLLLRCNHVTNICKYSSPNVLSLLNDRVVLIGGANGTIYAVRMPDATITIRESEQHVEEWEVKPKEGITKLFSGLIPTTPFTKGVEQPDRAILSIVAHTYNSSSYIFTLCADKKLRIWSFDKAQLLIEETLRPEPWNTHGTHGQVVKSSMKLLADINNPQKFSVIIAFTLKEESQVYTYSGSIEGREAVVLHEDRINYSTMDNLVDFHSTSSAIWAIWGVEDGKYSAMYAPLDRSDNLLEVSNWFPVKMADVSNTPQKIIVSTTEKELEEQYLNHIFEPGVFTKRIILKAFQREVSDNLSEGKLRQHLVSEIHNQYNERLLSFGDSDLTESASLELLQSLWQRFLLNCISLWREENTPIGMHVDPISNIVILIKRGGISYIRPCEPVESLYINFEMYPSKEKPQLGLIRNNLVTSALISNNTFSFSDDILHLFSCFSLISQQLGTSALAAFESDLKAITEPRTAALPHVETLLTGVSEGHALALRDFTGLLLKHLRVIKKPIDTVLVLLAMMDNTSSDLMDEEQGISVEWSNTLFIGNAMGSLVTGSVKQVAYARFCVVRDLLFLLMSLLSLRNQTGMSRESLSAIQAKLLPEVVGKVKVYFTMQWLASQFPGEPTTGYGIEAQLGSMEISKNVPKNNLTLLQLYYHKQFNIIHHTIIAKHPHVFRLSTSTEHKMQAWSIIDSIIRSFIHLLSNPNRAIDFIAFLEQQSQYYFIHEFILLMDCHTSSYQHIFGESLLNLKEYSKSRDLFFSAASELDSSITENNEYVGRWVLAQCQKYEETDEMDVLVQYYISVMRLFESHRQHGYAIEFAYAALGAIASLKESGEQTTKYVWSAIFKHALALDRYDEAYIAALQNPDESRRIDALRRFVVVLCENNKVEYLCELPFEGYLEEVKKILEEKARYSDIHKQNYYNILYAFHISKSNYRQAAIVMYELAQRSVSETHSKEVRYLQQQADCYVSAMYALKLVSSKNQWIPIQSSQQHRDFNNMPPSPKRKRDDDSRIEFMDFVDTSNKSRIVEKTAEEKEKEEISVIELSDIEKQYVLTVCNIKLAQKNSKLPVSGILLPEDTIALLADAGLYDDAFTLAVKFNSNMQTLFEIMTKKCLQYQSMSSHALMPYDGIAIAEDIQEKENSLWAVIEENLNKYDSANTNYQYHINVAEKILSTDSRIKLPTWLIVSFKKKHSSALLRIYMKYGLWEDAATLVLYIISVSMDISQKQWLPVTLIDNLLLTLRNVLVDRQVPVPVKEKLTQLNNDIQSSLANYKSQVVK